MKDSEERIRAWWLVRGDTETVIAEHRRRTGLVQSSEPGWATWNEGFEPCRGARQIRAGSDAWPRAPERAIYARQ